jgi:hypothetical protein
LKSYATVIPAAAADVRTSKMIVSKITVTY